MYKIQGADGNEYGPVSREQLGQWIVEGRANAQTRVHLEGAADWVALGTLPEFQEFLTQPQPSLPPAAAASPGSLKLDIGSCLSRSWNLFKNNMGLLIGATALIGVLVLAFEMLVNLVVRIQPPNMADPEQAIRFFLSAFVKGIPGMILYPVLYAGLYGILLKLMRGQAAGIGDVFIGFQVQPIQIVVGSVLVSIFTFIGICLCLIPGIYLSIAYVFTIPLVLDREISGWQAMELGRKTVTKQWFSVFCLVVLMVIVLIGGALACCVGLLAAVPIGFGMLAFAYEDLFPRATG